MIPVSVVLPAHNCRELLRLCLAGFATQTYPHTRFEVVVVDDASTDGTAAMARDQSLPYPCKVLELPDNRGPATARNRGLAAADGELIIFCDADTVAPPEFIARHAELQAAGEPLLVSGAAQWLPLYTCLHPRMSPGFAEAVRKLAGMHPWIAERLPQEWEKIDHPLPLARVGDILAGRTGAFHVPPTWPGFMHAVVTALGERLDAFPTGWMACIGRNISLPRDVVRAAGGFDPEFQGYGQQDWEFGYRLQRSGVGILCTERVANYHQEHPVRCRARLRSNLENYRRFSEKHRCAELDFFAACQLSGHWSPLRLGHLYMQVREAAKRHELAPLNRLFGELAASYRRYYLGCAKEPPRSAWADLERTWDRHRLRQVRRARRSLPRVPGTWDTLVEGVMSAAAGHLAHGRARSGGNGARRPRVLHLVGWPTIGGISTYVRDACRLVQRAGGEALVVGAGGPAVPMLKEAAGVFVRYGRDVDHLADPGAQAEELAALLQPDAIDVVHCHRGFELATAVRLAARCGCRLVVTLHNHSSHETLEMARQHADYLLFASEALARSFASRHGPPLPPAAVCLPGIDVSAFRPGRRDPKWLEAHGVPGHCPVVAYVGRVDKDKVHVPRHVIRAAARLRERYPDLRALVVAPGASRLTDLARSAAAECGGPVAHLLEARDDLVPVYRGATVVVGSGRVAMEALACGRPVVACGAAGAVGVIGPETLSRALETNFGDHGGNREGNAGIELGVAELLADPQRRAELVRFGRRLALERLGLNQLQAGLWAAYGLTGPS